MRKRLFAALLAAALLLSAGGCGRMRGTPPEGAYALYFAVSPEGADAVGEAAVDFEYRVLPEGGDRTGTLVEALLAGPEDPVLASPFPAGVRLRSWEQEPGGGLHLDMNESYGALSGIGLTIADYCLTLTLCQLEGVRYVHITVMGEELPFWRADALREDDVILSGAEEQPVTLTVALYYPRTSGAGLGVEYRDVLVTEGDNLAGVVMSAYCKGPTYQSFRSALPEGTELLSATVDSGVCYVNFSAALQSVTGGEREARLLVYSIVNTAAGMEKVETVQLQVEGENLTSLGGVPTVALKPDFQPEPRS